MGRGSFSIGTIAGVRIALHPSWLVIAFLVTYSLAVGDLPARFPRWEPALHWVVAAGVAALFFLSVLAHEMSHALVARRFGIRVSDITLFVFGGAAQLEGDARSPRQEALIAVAGPLCSLLIGAMLYGVGAVTSHPQLGALVAWLAFINLTLGVFNLFPGFPMDGGRLLRALLWRLRGDQFAATRNAAMVGRGFGYLLIAGGVFLAFQSGGLFSGIWLALIGWFITTAAEAAVAQAGVQRTLLGVRVRDVMDPEPPSVSPNEPVGDLIHERMMRGEGRSFLVRHDDGGLAGIVTLTDVRRVAREDWPHARVTDIMTRFADLATAHPDEPVEEALERLQEREVNQLPVVDEDGRTVVGLLTRAGIVRLIDTRMKLGV
ncbi:MAG TPA: site-2 protease family protein [candidate division Zixibacteria bacterium]|nr:site-2 protease family protein [candidate division Zixibacteria bacterium]